MLQPAECSPSSTVRQQQHSHQRGRRRRSCFGCFMRRDQPPESHKNSNNTSSRGYCCISLASCSLTSHDRQEEAIWTNMRSFRSAASGLPAKANNDNRSSSLCAAAGRAAKADSLGREDGHKQWPFQQFTSLQLHWAPVERSQTDAQTVGRASKQEEIKWKLL